MMRLYLALTLPGQLFWPYGCFIVYSSSSSRHNFSTMSTFFPFFALRFSSSLTIAFCPLDSEKLRLTELCCSSARIWTCVCAAIDRRCSMSCIRLIQVRIFFHFECHLFARACSLSTGCSPKIPRRLKRLSHCTACTSSTCTFGVAPV